MKDELQIGSKSLNAYLDDELDAEVAAHLERQLTLNPNLRRHLHELEQVRVLVRAALTAEPETLPPLARRRAGRRWAGYGLAAALLVGIGIGVDRWLQPPTGTADLLASLPAHAQVIRPADLEVAAPVGERRALFHVTSANPGSVRSTLDHVERLLRRQTDAAKPLRVEIVVNGEGLNALRADVSPARDQIARLHRDYPNVAFLACANTIARVKREQGVDVKLLPQAAVTSSALDQILLRLRQGWIYIRL
jgi:hypothetical protein